MPLSVEDQSRLNAILERNRRRPELLIQVLQDMQGEYKYLPEEGLCYVSEQLGVPLPRIFHVATFYKAFSLKPRGKHVINVCRGTACHVRGSERLVGTVQRELGVRDGETSEDMEFTLECVNCVGACALAPVVVIDGVVYDKVTPDRLRKIIDEYRNGKTAKPEAAPPQPAAAVPQSAPAQAAPAEAPAPPAAETAPPEAAEPVQAAAAPAEAASPEAPPQQKPSARRERRTLRRARRLEKKSKGKGKNKEA